MGDAFDQHDSVTLFEDPIEKQYEQEFIADFELLDDDADTAAFDFKQQQLLFTYLQTIKGHLENISVEELPVAVRDELVEEIVHLEQELPVQTKNKYIKKLGGFVAKARKKSFQLGEYVLKEFAKEVIKESVKRGINFVPDKIAYYKEQIALLLG